MMILFEASGGMSNLGDAGEEGVVSDTDVTIGLAYRPIRVRMLF